MVARSGSFSYIRSDSKGKPYTIKVNFTAMPQSHIISAAEPMDVIAVMAIEIDEESGFQRIDDYYIRENSIGVLKNQRFNPIESQVLYELKELVLAKYQEMENRSSGEY